MCLCQEKACVLLSIKETYVLLSIKETYVRSV